MQGFSSINYIHYKKIELYPHIIEIMKNYFYICTFASVRGGSSREAFLKPRFITLYSIK